VREKKNKFGGGSEEERTAEAKEKKKKSVYKKCKKLAQMEKKNPIPWEETTTNRRMGFRKGSKREKGTCLK